VFSFVNDEVYYAVKREARNGRRSAGDGVAIDTTVWMASIVVSYLGNVNLVFHNPINQSMLFINSSRPKARK